MNKSEDAYSHLELEFANETIKRYLATHPDAAPKIALQLLAKLREQRQEKLDLEQKYDDLLTSYLNLNDAYLATLRLLRDRDR